jgi:hypothetical protein
MEDKLSLLIKIAQQRSGLVLLDDLKQLHFSPSAITRLVSRGILRRVHRGMVYALSDEHLNFEAETLPLVLQFQSHGRQGSVPLNIGESAESLETELRFQ